MSYNNETFNLSKEISSDSSILTIVSVFFHVKMSHFAGSYTLNVKIHCLFFVFNDGKCSLWSFDVGWEKKKQFKDL